MYFFFLPESYYYAQYFLAPQHKIKQHNSYFSSTYIDDEHSTHSGHNDRFLWPDQTHRGRKCLAKKQT